MQKLEPKIHDVLAPNLEMDDTRDQRKCLNTKCDVQMVWTHLWHETDALITSDKGIWGKTLALAKLGATVKSPASFASALSKSTLA